MTARRDLVQRLLGPAGPEIGCDECFALLDLYVERRGHRMPAMEAHLDGCRTCRDEWQSLSAYVASRAAPPARGRP